MHTLHIDHVVLLLSLLLLLMYFYLVSVMCYDLHY